MVQVANNTPEGQPIHELPCDPYPTTIVNSNSNRGPQGRITQNNKQQAEVIEIV